MQRFTDNGDNTVTDNTTGLTWTKTTIAQEVNHQAAETAAAALGDGWRLPTVNELFSLVDHTQEEPAIDTGTFPDTQNDWYWTSTKTAWNEAAVWVVYFGLGDAYGSHRDSGACVRAVRSGQ